jgi:hypothetical protein
MRPSDVSANALSLPALTAVMQSIETETVMSWLAVLAAGSLGGGLLEAGAEPLLDGVVWLPPLPVPADGEDEPDELGAPGVPVPLVEVSCVGVSELPPVEAAAGVSVAVMVVVLLALPSAVRSRSAASSVFCDASAATGPGPAMTSCQIEMPKTAANTQASAAISLGDGRFMVRSPCLCAR